MVWGWVNFKSILIFGWTSPLKKLTLLNSNNAKLLLVYSVKAWGSHFSSSFFLQLLLTLQKSRSVFIFATIPLKHVQNTSCWISVAAAMQERIKGLIITAVLVHIDLDFSCITASTDILRHLNDTKEKDVIFITVMAGMFEPGTLIFNIYNVLKTFFLKVYFTQKDYSPSCRSNSAWHFVFCGM